MNGKKTLKIFHGKVEDTTCSDTNCNAHIYKIHTSKHILYIYKLLFGIEIQLSS